MRAKCGLLKGGADAAAAIAAAVARGAGCGGILPPGMRGTQEVSDDFHAQACWSSSLAALVLF